MSLLRSIRKTYQYFVDVPINEGTVLHNRYEVLHVIGSGSYGLVYLCKDLKYGKNRVIKQLRKSKQRNKKEVKLFINEISVLRKVDHDYMPKLYETFQENGSYFYVMSYIDGDNLEDEIFYNKKKFSEKESLLLLKQLLKLVEHLHIRNIYHLDLRIPNILIKEEAIYLIDFGLAMRINSAEVSEEDALELKLQDFYDLGEILLYLLYTTFTSKTKKALPWTEELSLKDETVHLIKRLLQVKEPYKTICEIAADLDAAERAQD